MILTRTRRPAREIRSLCQGENAWKATDGLAPGCEIYGFSKGQFSLIDLVDSLLRRIGPAHVTISTWTAARREIDVAGRMVRDERILSLRFLVDFSFPRRQPEYCALLRDRFGDDALRVTKCHAKFVMLRNAGWNLVVRTSMNLNQNDRFENFELSDDREMADFLEGVVSSFWSSVDSAAAFGERPIFHVDKFMAWGQIPRNCEPSRFGKSLDDPSKPGVSSGGVR